MMKTKTTRARIPAIQNPFDRALKYLSLRSRSVKEVSDYLLKKGYSLEDANNAIQKLLELKFLNDDNFARSFTEQKQKKGKSRMAIEFELKLKGINKEISQDVLNYSKSDFKIAYEYIAKRMKQFERYDDETKKNKIISRLRSRGYSWDTISKVLKKIDNTFPS